MPERSAVDVGRHQAVGEALAEHRVERARLEDVDQKVDLLERWLSFRAPE